MVYRKRIVLNDNTNKIADTSLSQNCAIPWLRKASWTDTDRANLTRREGRGLCQHSTIDTMLENGQILTQHVDFVLEILNYGQIQLPIY